ncbi:hypothetical protein CYMTET_34229 [Cymbomonas tetramitiformis]|uniref:Right handed beta helix domain-containing protein n=1 Tax=Cymbomonas tetramitiformis TaxID=36881 RepID=A0AAE0FBG6_9CHLO|nr:hypothetical protein CYMTET_34229 [Cymbomonas tetramitiformis]
MLTGFPSAPGDGVCDPPSALGRAAFSLRSSHASLVQLSIAAACSALTWKKGLRDVCGDVSFDNCVLANNTVVGGAGGGAVMLKGPELVAVFVRSTFLGNHASCGAARLPVSGSCGGAALVEGGRRALFEQCTFTANVVACQVALAEGTDGAAGVGRSAEMFRLGEFPGGGAVAVGGQAVTIRSSVLANNVAMGGGALLHSGDDSSDGPAPADRGRLGGGMGVAWYLMQGSALFAIQCSLERNSCEGHGGGARLARGSNLTASISRFNRNQAPTGYPPALILICVGDQVHLLMRIQCHGASVSTSRHNLVSGSEEAFSRGSRVPPSTIFDPDAMAGDGGTVEGRGRRQAMFSYIMVKLEPAEF